MKKEHRKIWAGALRIKDYSFLAGKDNVTRLDKVIPIHLQNHKKVIYGF